MDHFSQGPSSARMLLVGAVLLIATVCLLALPSSSSRKIKGVDGPVASVEVILGTKDTGKEGDQFAAVVRENAAVPTKKGRVGVETEEGTETPRPEQQYKMTRAEQLREKRKEREQRWALRRSDPVVPTDESDRAPGGNQTQAPGKYGRKHSYSNKMANFVARDYPDRETLGSFDSAARGRLRIQKKNKKEDDDEQSTTTTSGPPKTIFDATTQCLAGSSNLFIGHSHIDALAVAFCQLLHDDPFCMSSIVRKWSWHYQGTQPWYWDAVASFNNGVKWRRAFDSYLTLASMGKPPRRKQAKSGGGKFDGATLGQKYNNIFVGSWAWDLIYRNTHPDEVYRRTMQQVKTLSATFLNGTTAVGTARNRPNNLIFLMPHYHRKPSWKSRVPCQANEARLKSFAEANEKAAYDLQQHFLEHKHEVNVQLVDVYRWSRDLDEAKDYRPDQQHLNPDHTMEVAMALLLDPKSRLCLSGGSRPQEKLYRELGQWYGPWFNTTLSKRASGKNLDQLWTGPKPVSPKDEEEGEGELHYGEHDERQKPVELLRKPRNIEYKFDRPWPSLPSCEAHRPDLTSWFHTSGMRAPFRPFNWNSGFSKYRHHLAAHYHSASYPDLPVVRDQLIFALETKHYFRTKGFRIDVAKPSLIECFATVGLDENSTTWQTGEELIEMGGNLQFVKHTQAERSEEAWDALRKSTDKKPSLQKLLPSCSCMTSTELWPRLQKYFTKDLPHRALLVSEDQIRRYCGMVVKAATDFVKKSYTASAFNLTDYIVNDGRLEKSPDY